MTGSLSWGFVGSAPPPITVADRLVGAHDVGLIMKRSRLTYTRIARTWITMPLMMCGIWFAAPEGMLTAAVSGLISNGRCTTTVPRSNGPTCALVIDTTENGAHPGAPALHGPLPL